MVAKRKAMIEHQRAESERRARKIARAAQEAERLVEDTREVSSTPPDFAQFVIGKFKDRYPNFYVSCERAWQALQKKRDSVGDRSRHIINMVAEWDKEKEDENQYY